MQLRSIPISELSFDKEYLVHTVPIDGDDPTVDISTPEANFEYFQSYVDFYTDNNLEDSKETQQLYLKKCEEYNETDEFLYLEFYEIEL